MVFACVTEVNDKQQLRLCDKDGLWVKLDELRFIDGYWQGHKLTLKRNINEYIDEMCHDKGPPAVEGFHVAGARKTHFRGLAMSSEDAVNETMEAKETRIPDPFGEYELVGIFKLLPQSMLMKNSGIRQLVQSRSVFLVTNV